MAIFLGVSMRVLQLKSVYGLVDSVEETDLSTCGHHLVCQQDAEERIQACLPLPYLLAHLTASSTPLLPLLALLVFKT